MSYIELFYPDNEARSSTWAGAAYAGQNTSHYPTSVYPGVYGRTHMSSGMVPGVVKLHVSLCCEKCVQKVRKALSEVDDIDSVDVDMHKESVVVRGRMNPDTILRKVRKVKKSAAFWDPSHAHGSYSTGAYGHYGSGPGFNGYDVYSHGHHSPSSYDYDHHHRRGVSQDYDYDYFRTPDYSRFDNANHNRGLYDTYRHR